MTPKEKAEELQQKFYPLTMDWAINQRGAEYAKQCALICVEEIIKEISDIDDGQTNIPYDYWRKVKQEIEKL